MAAPWIATATRRAADGQKSTASTIQATAEGKAGHFRKAVKPMHGSRKTPTMRALMMAANDVRDYSVISRHRGWGLTLSITTGGRNLVLPWRDEWTRKNG